MYATVEFVKKEASFTAVSSLPDEKITGYIDRATSWIHRAAKRSLEQEMTLSLAVDLRTATVLLVEYLWYNDNQDMKEANLSPVETEKIGSYSYTMRDVDTVDSIKEREYEGVRTGIKELDLILESLAPAPPSAFFFATSRKRS